MSKDRWLCVVDSWDYLYNPEEPTDTPPSKLFYIYGDDDEYSSYAIQDYLKSIGKSDWSPTVWWMYDGLLPEDVSKNGWYDKPGGRTIYRKYFVKRYGLKAWNRIYGKNFHKE